MKLKPIWLGAIGLAAILTACGGGDNSNETAGTFCKDSACITEPLRFGSSTDDKPFATVTFKDCKIDSIHVFKGKKEGKVDIVFSDFFPNTVVPSKSYFAVDFIEGKNVWIKLNDCPTGRGYLVKLPLTKEGSTAKYSSAVNSFDPKFRIEDGLVSYYDNTFIYVEDIHTGLTAKTLLTETGVTDVDHDNIHSFIDSVNISKQHIYAKLMYKGKDIVHDKPLTFK